MVPDIDNCAVHAYAVVDVARRIDSPYPSDGPDGTAERSAAYGPQPFSSKSEV